MKYYIIAGEASGDLHASNLMKEIKLLDKSADFRFWGGDLMKEQGTELVKHYRELAFMGFVEVLMNIKAILKNIKFCKNDILIYKPDVLILVDYPGFNLRIAKFAHKKGIKIFYYISPQVWAWQKSRVKKIKKFIDRMFVILPFEKSFYDSYSYNVDFVGHPLFDAIGNNIILPEKETFYKKNNLSKKPIIALLPGSRKQEISKMLSVMLTIIPDFQNYQFVIGGVSSVPMEFYKNIIKNNKVSIVFNQMHNLLRNAHAALVTSGTATLETALFEIPEVVCYKGSFLSYLLAKSFINVKFISLVNLIMNKQIVVELIQNNFNKKNLIKELHKIISDEK
ncbi:MAG: lipid-A-disaccharide synthase, partial [Bacteroidales bacterium]|nr:lipid-A-disaccharide synthase [Bacteroidales bacterium]